MIQSLLKHLDTELSCLHANGLYKTERAIRSAQSSTIQVGERQLVNLCANNYLGLADDRRLSEAASASLDSDGYGMASVRFICGTHELHRQLESALAHFLGKEDSILFAACFDANGGLFEPLLQAEDAIVSDSLNHASIIDGIRLCKAQRYRYPSNDMDALEEQLVAARNAGARHVMIASDGVFSMDGTLAQLDTIVELAEHFDAIVMVDDCHATGFMGEGGRGTAHHAGVADGVDIVTGTLGKALGGALGGFTAGPQAVIDILRQRARPYLFSNALPPMICAAGLEALRIVEAGDDLRKTLFDNARYWRDGLESMGFELKPGEHPIIPIMLGDARLSQDMANTLFETGVYVSGFFYPVVPKGQARIRTQMSAALSRDDLDFALEAFSNAGRKTGALS